MTIELDETLVPMLCAAAGDALGAGVEFERALTRALTEDPEAVGRRFFPYSPFGFAPGELTDDTQMAWAALSALVGETPDTLTTPGALAFTERLADAFRNWVSAGPPDVGGLTRSALSRRGADGGWYAWGGGQSAGNGSLMRATAPYAAGYRGRALHRASALDSAVTHADPRCVAACVWYGATLEFLMTEPAEAASTAYRAGLRVLVEADVVAWLRPVAATVPALLGAFRDRWNAARDEVVARVEGALAGTHIDCLSSESRGWPTGFVLDSLGQSAWAALAGNDAADAVRLAVANGGHDADTIGAIAGGLAGARFGLAALESFEEGVLWALRLGHRWPGVPCDGPFVERLANLVSSADGTPPPRLRASAPG